MSSAVGILITQGLPGRLAVYMDARQAVALAEILEGAAGASEGSAFELEGTQVEFARLLAASLRGAAVS